MFHELHVRSVHTWNICHSCLTHWVIRVLEVVLELPSHKGIPALAGLLRVRETGSAGKTIVKSRRGFPKAFKQAIWEAPEALRQPHSVVAQMRGKWVFPWARLWMCGRWVFPRAMMMYAITWLRGRRVFPWRDCL